ncbi:MAG: glutaredoxin family protein [Proteobacteria bacterium]|nr:glutaredoxin family protein [Burkholderiales bacterium]
MSAFIIYIHDYCHLCETMLAELQPLVAAGCMALQVVDLDERPDLQSVYSARVPVLTRDDGELICFARIDAAAHERLMQAVEPPEKTPISQQLG